MIDYVTPCMDRVERKRKTIDPCLRCGLNRTLCLCALIPEIILKTRVTLLIHAKELKRTTNSGRLAIEALKNSEMIVRGASGPVGSRRLPPVDLAPSLLPSYVPVLFFPADDALELKPELVASLSENYKYPIQLLVPDGNWRQASKVHSRHPELANVPRVKISTPNTAKNHLRVEHLAAGMSTLEAIAKAIGIVESREAEAKLLALYREKLERTLQGRGLFR